MGIYYWIISGELAERSKATVSKIVILLVGIEGSNPSLSAIFFCLDFKAKNMKPEKALLHTASAVLHILRQCRKMLHTPTGVLHLIRTSLFR